jgi:glycine cleavage system transcriptional repressor
MTGAMKSYLVLSAIGPDRPGIVDEVSKFLFECGGNLEDSRMAVLGGEFALVVLVSGAPEKIAAVREQFPAFATERGMVATAKETAGPEGRKDKGFVAYQVRAVGLDHEGIVYHIAHALRELGANIESMDTQATSAPVSGAPMFTLSMRMTIPPQVPLADVRSKLQAAGDKVNVDLIVEAA